MRSRDSTGGWSRSRSTSCSTPRTAEVPSWPSPRPYTTTQRCGQRAVSTLTRRGGLTKHSRRDSSKPSSTNTVESRSYFNSDCGARFQRRDSDMAMEVMTRMIQRTGRCPLPIHDSFLVADIDTESLRQTMKEVARHHGLRLKVKESKAVSTTIEDLIDTHSPLVHPQHHCPGRPSNRLHHSTPSVSQLYPETPTRGLLRPVHPLCPTPGIQLEVTTPDLQGQTTAQRVE